MKNVVIEDYLSCTYIFSSQRDVPFKSLSIFFLVHLLFFCLLQCIHTLTWQCVYRAIFVISCQLACMIHSNFTKVCMCIHCMVRDSSVATGWAVRGSNPGRGRDFPHPSRPALGSTQPIQGVPRLSRG